MKLTKSIILFLPFVFILLNGCIPFGNYHYVRPKHAKDETIVRDSSPVYIIMPGSYLRIDVRTNSLSDDDIFQREIQLSTRTQTTQGMMSPYLTGYVVNDSGQVNLPLAGKIMLKGLTLSQANDTITAHLNKYLNYVTVTTKCAGIVISTLGEFRSVGRVIIPYDKANILEAVSQCGDLTEFGNKSKLKIIRQSSDRKSTQIITVDISNRDIIKSPYYYIQPNDILYAEPFFAKAFQRNSAFFMSLFGLVGALTGVVALINVNSR